VPTAGPAPSAADDCAAGRGRASRPGTESIHLASKTRKGGAPLTSEVELLELARGGDPDAFAALIAPLQRRAYTLALRMLGEREEAADVTQDALVRAYTRIADFRGEASFATWLHRIVHNTALDALRWRARHPIEALDPMPSGGGEPVREVASATAGPEDIAVRADERRAIERALAALTPEFRAVVVLRDVQGLDYEEVAAVTGVSLGTVKSRLHRARARLRQLLAADGTESPSETSRGVEGGWNA
jgi:RNA polymerase sigma-70 factor (ECF subfamily)